MKILERFVDKSIRDSLNETCDTRVANPFLSVLNPEACTFTAVPERSFSHSTNQKIIRTLTTPNAFTSL